MSLDANNKLKDDEGQPVPGSASHNRTVLALLVSTFGIVAFIETMFIPSLPSIASEFNVTISQSSLVITLTMVFGTAIIPVIGKMADLYGRKRVLSYVMAVLIASVVGGAFSTNFEMLLVSRFFQGVGFSILPLSFSIIRSEFPLKDVPKGEGIMGAMEGGSAAIGLTLGAFVSARFGWQFTLKIMIPLLLLVALLLFIYLENSGPERKKGKLDFIGAVWLGASITAIVLALSEGPTWGFGSFSFISMESVGALSVTSLFLYERRISEPILDIHLLKRRNVLISNSIMTITSVVLYSSYLSVTYRLELSSPIGFGFSIFTTGVYLLPLSVTILLIAFPVSAIMPKFGAKPFVLIGGMVGAMGFLLLAFSGTAAEMVVFLSLGSIGTGMIYIATNNILILSVRKSESAISTSMNTVLAMVGSSLGAPIFGTLLSSFTKNYLLNGSTITGPSPVAFQFAFFFTALGLVSVSLLSLMAREVLGKNGEVIGDL